MPSRPTPARSVRSLSIPAHELVLAQLRRSIHLGHFGAGDQPAAGTRAGEAARRLAHDRAGGGSRAGGRGPGRDQARLVRRHLGASRSRRAGRSCAAASASSRRSSSSASRSSRWPPASPRSAAPRPTSPRCTRRSSGSPRSPRRARRAPSPTGCGRTASYHLLIARMARNGRLLIAAIEEARAGMFLPIGAVFGGSSRAPTSCTRLHDAIVAGDADRAGAAMTRTSRPPWPTCAPSSAAGAASARFGASRRGLTPNALGSDPHNFSAEARGSDGAIRARSHDRGARRGCG